MVDETAVITRPPHRAAAVISEVTSPTICAPALLLAVSVATAVDHGAGAIGWGALAAFFVGVLPLIVLRLGARRGHWTDHHVPERESRIVPLSFAALSVVTGLMIMVAGNAPDDLVALVAAMLAGVAAILVVSRFWKISIHVSVVGGTAVILALVFGVAGALIGSVVLAACLWARVAAGAHTWPQVLAGAFLGSAIAAVVFPVLR